MTEVARPSACDTCLRRSWLIARLAPNLELAWRSRRPLRDILALSDEDLVAALAGDGAARVTAEHDAFAAAPTRSACARVRLAAVCLHDPAYPPALRETPDAPAVLYAAGDWQRGSVWLAGRGADGVATASVVGTRRASDEGLEVARSLGRGLAAAGVVVVSGMALGIDSAGHEGALEVGGPTVAVLACGPERAYPVRKTALHRRLIAGQLVVSELPPGCPPWRWSFPARNRIIAALGATTIVVEAAERSGSLITADFANDLGREVGAVPGRAWSARTRGSNGLLKDGAAVILDVEDALDLVLGGDRSRAPTTPTGLAPEVAAVLEAIAAGAQSLDALAAGGREPQALMPVLGELELLGLVARLPGGRYVTRAPTLTR